MDTHGLGNKAKTNRSTEYDNRVNIHDNGQELIVTEGYIQLELLSQESPYSYAKESDVSNGTVSSYVDGRVGILNSHDSNKTVDQDANTDYNHTSTETVASNKRAENHTCTKTVDQNARAENHTSTRTVTRNKRAENYTRTGTVDRNALAEKHTRSGTVDRTALAEKHTRSGTVDRNAHAENKTRAGTVDRNAHAENKTRAGTVDRNAHAENKTRTGTVDRNAHAESHIRIKTVDRDVRERYKVKRDRDVRTEERSASCLVPIVSYHSQSGSQQVRLGQDQLNLSDSTRSSSTTYDKILDSNVITHVQNSRNSTSTQGEKSGNSSRRRNDICSPRRCIIATIFVLIILIAAGVLIYFVFVIDDPPNPCERLPEVKHGVFKSHASGQAEVTCDQGFVLNGSSTIICQNEVWSKLPSCKPIECGPYPQIDNGVVNGSGKSFGSKANIICNPGFYVVDIVTTVACLADGNWTPASECREHPCGNYTLLDDMVANEKLMYTTTTLCLQCKAGLEFVHKSDRCVTCQNGRWQGSPECEIPGTIDFDPVEPIYNVSDPVSLRCVVHNSSEWQSLLLARSGFQSTSIEPLFEVTNKNGNIQVNNFSKSSTFTARPERLDDGVAIVFEVDKVRCNDSGVYICGNILGNYTSPVKVKSTNTSVYITDTKSSVPNIIVPETMYENIEAAMTCTGELGKSDNDTALGGLVIQIRYKDAASFTILPSIKNYSLVENCRIKESIVSLVIPDIAMQEAFLRCVVLMHDKIEISSPEEQLNIVSPIVSISTLSSAFDIGETAAISVTLDLITGWNLIEVRRMCRDGSEVIAGIDIDTPDEHFLVGEHVRVMSIHIQTTSVSFDLTFEPVNCSDACGSVGEVEYIVAVRINNDTWIQNSTDIMFQRQPGIPTLEIIYNGMNGQVANFKCTGEIGAPKGYLEIESNFEGSNFTVFLSQKDNEYDKNEIGSITSITENNGKCSTRRVIEFRINTVTAKYHNKLLKCISKPSQALTNGKAAESTNQVIEVIPENYCTQNQVYTGVIRHPYHCNMFVGCHSGDVSGVPAGCGQGNCFHETTCYPCETIGGCSVTDIYIDNFVDQIQIGDSVTLICKVKDFDGLTDIVIYKDNSTIISSFLNGETNTGFNRVTELSYITGNSGQLMLVLALTQCDNAGTYRCVPDGAGKHSADETSLVLKDTDGNIIC